MERQEVIAKCKEDTGCAGGVTAVLSQRMLWDGYLEYQVFTDDKKVYSALYDNESGMFLTAFVEVIPQVVSK